jgi:hypothetical protein
MGFAYGVGPCVGCRNIMTYNPMRVPSIRVNGEREPVCASCVRRWNDLRIARGLPPFPEPLPDAYEPCDETELG